MLLKSFRCIKEPTRITFSFKICMNIDEATSFLKWIEISSKTPFTETFTPYQHTTIWSKFEKMMIKSLSDLVGKRFIFSKNVIYCISRIAFCEHVFYMRAWSRFCGNSLINKLFDIAMDKASVLFQKACHMCHAYRSVWLKTLNNGKKRCVRNSHILLLIIYCRVSTVDCLQ